MIVIFYVIKFQLFINKKFVKNYIFFFKRYNLNVQILTDYSLWMDYFFYFSSITWKGCGGKAYHSFSL